MLEKAKNIYHNGGGKNKAAEYYQNNQNVLRENGRISIETCLKKKKKQ